jgi:predicted ester cyclase
MHKRRSYASILLACVVICASACATRDSRTRVVRNYIDELLVHQRWQEWDAMMGEHLSYNGVPFGRDAFQAVARFLHSTFGDVSVTVEQQLVDGPWVVTRVTVRGHQTGNFLNVPPHNQLIRFRATLMDRLDGGRVVEMWHEYAYWDALLQVAQP